MKPSIRKHFLFLLFFAFLTIVLNQKIGYNTDIKTVNYAPPNGIKYFLLGYNDIVADSLWIRILQNPDECEMNRSPVAGPRTGVNRIANCKQGWVYHMLDAATDIAPKFRAPYEYGPLFLSVLVDDVEGATLFFEKALRRYPKDWLINYQAATHYMRETGDLKRAAELYETAAKNGAPKWVYALAANLYRKSGQAFAAKMLLEHFLKRAPKDFKFRDRIEKRLAEANAVLDEEKRKQQE